MLIEDLLIELDKPLKGMKNLPDMLYKKITDNWHLFPKGDIHNILNEILGITCLVDLTTNHLIDLCSQYQEEVSNNYAKIIENEK